MKINEVDKVTTLAPTECITAIAADGSLIQISVSEMAKVMENMMPTLGNAFAWKRVSVRTGETAKIGIVTGLMVICFAWSDSRISVYIVSSKGRTIDKIHGNGYPFLDYSFNELGELLVHSQYSIPSAAAYLDIAYQRMSF